LATKFTYKMRSGGKRDVGSGTRPVQTQLLKKNEWRHSLDHSWFTNPTTLLFKKTFEFIHLRIL
jgi:hypothetical protein